MTRIDRDLRPLFTPGSVEEGGLINDRPFVNETWTGNDLGDLFLGGKFNVLTEHRQQPFAMALRGTMKLPTADQSAQLTELNAKLAAARQSLAAVTPELTAARAKWEGAATEALVSGADAWKDAKPTVAESQSGTKLTVQKDGTILASGPNPATETYTLSLPLETAGLRGLKLAVLADAKFPNKGLSRSNGNRPVMVASFVTASAASTGSAGTAAARASLMPLAAPALSRHARG